MTDEFLRFAAALFAIMNPFGNIAIFLSITADRSAAERRKIATVTAAAVLITLLVAAALGQEILALFGISVGAFRIAGGVVVLLYGQHAQGLLGWITIAAVIVLMCGVLLLALHAAGRLSAFLGTTGMNVLTRLMGMLLAAIAVEMMAGGLIELFPQLRQAG
jgi:multiple antibiotic resistance protein